ncbi:MFS transporter [Sphingomonas sp. H39-1-10]|uniref:MFS transporter n=1 Tax=Sphingomonas pollutisoli TaxID=3030829 RepID=UPI0023B97BD9|nr:MFS transporter [Sphingomonas pollutisoli]MDF0487475.1 MFS transporter [Sphingomonas pollutisoli]
MQSDERRGRSRALAVLTATSLALIIAQSVVFASFGIVLFATAPGLGLSASDSGFAYTVVVLGACIAAPAPMLLIRWIGGGRTIILGQAVLCAAFLILGGAHALGELYAAALLGGVGFSLSGNSPAVFLLSGWAGTRAARWIGIYMMIGMLGNAVGPPVAQALIAEVGWRGYCGVVALVAATMAGTCAACLREPPLDNPREDSRSPLRRLGRMLRSPIFLTLAAAVVASQICIITVASVAPPYLAAQGQGTVIAARLLSIEGLASALATGLLGFGVRLISARRLLPISLLAGAAGLAILASSVDTALLTAFAILVGVSVGGATLAVTLLLVRYFGPVQGAAALGAVWTLAGLAAFGPWIAGIIADSSGSYAPAFFGIALLLLPIAAGSALLLPRDVPDGRLAACRD